MEESIHLMGNLSR